MVKILFFTHSNKLSGGERSLFDIIRWFNRSMDVSLITPGEGRLSEVIEREGISVYKIPPSPVFNIRRERMGIRDFVNAGELGRIAGFISSIIHREGFNVLYTNSQKAHVIGALVKLRTTHVKLIWHFRDILEGKPRLLMNVLSFIPDTIISISKAVDRQFLRKTKVVYNAISLPDRIKPVKLPGKFKIGYVGQIARWKGQMNFIRVMEGFKDDGVVGYILGGAIFEEQDYLELLEKTIIEKGLEKKIKILGWRDNVYDYFSGFDLLIHMPEKPEPFGRVIVEAMALGIPVIAHDIGAIKEVVGDAGILVNFKDYDAVRYHVKQLLTDMAFYETLREKGLKRYREVFRIERLIKEVKGIIEG